MIGELVVDFAADGTNVYDLGCSTGATLLGLRSLNRNVTFMGIDSSAAMLAKADAALKKAGFVCPYVLREQQIDQDLVIENASVVILSLTLQFVRPLLREKVVQTIARGLNHQGCLILVEKVLARETLINRLFIKHYYELKRTNALLLEQMDALRAERDSLRSRLTAARTRIDALIERLPVEDDASHRSGS